MNNENQSDLLRRLQTANYNKSTAKAQMQDYQAKLDVATHEYKTALAQERHYRAQLKAVLK